MSITRKRNRNVLSIETKLEIIERLEKGETATVLAKVYNAGRATISDIKTKKDVILNFASKLDSQGGSKKRKTMRKAQDEKLDEAMFLWFVQRRSRGESISGPILQQQAFKLNYKLGGSSDFKASNGWLKNFKSRHGIKEFEIQGEARSGNASAADQFVETFLDYVQKEGYSADDLYNADETCLDWRNLPRKSLPSKLETAAPGFRIDTVTVMVTANASGTHSLPLLMIGKAKQSTCFKNVACLPLCYKTQNSACMTSEIFLDWYANDFVPDVKKFREEAKKPGKVLLLVDNAPFHQEAEKLNAVDGNFKVLFLPSNVAVLQPMDQGVKEKLKTAYKKQMMHRLLSAEDVESAINISKRLNLKDCCYMLADAWNTLSQDNLKRAWNKLLRKQEGNDEEYEEVNEIVDLFRTIPGFSDCDKEDAQTWLENEDDVDFEILEDQIVSSVEEERQMEPDERNVNHTEDEADQRGEVSHEEAFEALETAMSWYEKQEESCPSQLLMLKRMRDLATKKKRFHSIKKEITDDIV